MYPQNFRSGLLDQGAALGSLNKQVTLTANNQFVDMRRLSKLEITSDNTTATNRVFTLAGGYVDGQVLTLILTSQSSTTAKLADGGNCALSADWTPLYTDSLVVMWSQFLGLWVEISRASNH